MTTYTTNDLKRIISLMNGSGFDKDMAETQLKETDPEVLPEDILEIWKTGSSYDKFRAGRVKQTWAEQG